VCGRYTLARSQQELSERFGIKQIFIDLTARYNIAPSQKAPVILNLEGNITMDACRWGLVPAWAKHLEKGKALINARAETLSQRPSFKTALSGRRCLVPADGFYEWKKTGTARRPFYIHSADNALFAFAGIFDEHKNEEGVLLRTFSIITTQANDTMSGLHDRMPVILSADLESAWLDPALKEPGRLVSLLRPCPNELITMYEVSPKVNSVREDSPDLIEPAGGQLTLPFSF
jgi:putative SOS response-associated peptidase YedK